MVERFPIWIFYWRYNWYSYIGFSPKRYNLKRNKIMKQSAVEWLFDAVYIDMSYPEILGLIAQAKIMDKQQQGYSEEDLREAFKSGRMVKNYKAEWQETYSDDMTSGKYQDFNEWFEQFKKK